MTPPDERSRPAGNRTAPSDQLAGQINSDSIADLASVAEAAWETIVGLQLSSPSLDWARRTLEQLPAPAPDPVLNWWLTGVRLCVEALTVPNPITAADAAIRAEIEPPPGLRGHVVSEGYALVSTVTGVPLACVSDFVAVVRAATARRASQAAAQRLLAASWYGEMDELAELWQREAGAVLAQVTS